ncbi:MAG: hypothetical protein RIS35_1285 [Pseudomonadota bacterium]|jgi:cobalt-zinc-cadmium efflux system outer membrane protein
MTHAAQRGDPRGAAALAPRRLSLEDAERALLTGNREIRIARAEADAAASAIRQADVAPNPTVYASASNTESGRYGARDSDRIVRIEQTFERGDKRRLRIEAATATAEAARKALDETVRRQRSALAGGYFALWAARELESIAAQGAQAYRDLLAAAERRLAAGDLASIDVVRLRVEVLKAANEARSARREAEQAEVALIALLGEPAEPGFADAASRGAGGFLPTTRPEEFVAVNPVPDLPPSAERIERVLEGRADALAARMRVEAAIRAQALAASQRVRDVTLGLQGERAPAFSGTVFGVSAAIPLHVNNDYSADIARAAADRAVAEQMLEQTRTAIRADIARTVSDLSAAIDRAQSLQRQALPDARLAAEGVEFAFNKGAAGITDLFDARRQLAAIRIEAVRAQAEHAAAHAAFQAALAITESK